MNAIFKTVAASALVAGLAVATPLQAEANPLIVAPAVAALVLGGAVVGGVVVGSAVTSAQNGHKAVYVEDTTSTPAPNPCYTTRAIVHGVWHQVQVCD